MTLKNKYYNTCDTISSEVSHMFLAIDARKLEQRGIKHLEKCLITFKPRCKHEEFKLNSVVIIEVSYLEKEFYVLDEIPREITIEKTTFGVKSIINFIESPKDIPNGSNHFNSYCYRWCV